MPRRRGKPTREGAVLQLFRTELDLTEQQVADAAGVKPETVGLWERGRMPLSHGRLLEVLAKLEVPSEAVDEAFFSLELAHRPRGLSLPTAPPRDKRSQLYRAAAATGQRVTKTVRNLLLLKSHQEQARAHRLWADERWSSLEKLVPKKQEMVVEVLLGDEKSWALAERLCLASESAAAHKASEALRLARLALRLAEHSPGPEPWLLRLRGWCEPFLANAIRVGGELSASEEAFNRAEDLWIRGAEGDPYGLLDGARRLDLKASLLRQLGSFDEALALLEQALAGSPPEATARLLIKKAATHTRAGDYELALQVLEQAEPRIDEQREPRLLLVHRFSLTNTLCHLDRYEAAEPLVPLAETLVENLGNELDQVRTVWLKGKTWAGLGRREEALAVLSRVRRYFLSEKIAYDFALVSLEVAVLHLEQGRARLVQELAKEMLQIFKAQKIHKEALAALTLFCHASEGGEVEAEWIRRLIKFLYRAQHNPKLRFEP